MAYTDPTNVTLADVAATLEECPPLTGDPARATTLAAALLAPVQERDAPPLLAAELPGVIERLGPERAPALLIRIAELARQPAASPARSAVARLGASEPVPLRVTEAWRVADEAAEAFAFDLRRGVLGEVESRAFVLLDRRVDPEGRLAVGCAGPPEDQQLASLLTDLLDAPPEPVATEAAAAAIRHAWERTDAAGEAIPAELAVALTLLERPLLGAEEPPALRVDPSDVLYGEPDERLAVDVLENEEHAYATIDRLLDEYGEHAARLLADVDLPLPFVADSMLTYKVNYSDGLLGDWPPAELAAFLLDWWPRKVIAAPKTVHATLAAMLPFLAFLDSRDSLSGGSLAELADTLDELGEPFLDACEYVAGWEIERSLLASEQPPPAGHRGAHTDRRKRRKAARAARKRNRR